MIPVLSGITLQLLASALPQRGYASVHAPVKLRDVAHFEAAVLTNSIGVSPVGRIDDH